MRCINIDWWKKNEIVIKKSIYILVIRRSCLFYWLLLHEFI